MSEEEFINPFSKKNKPIYETDSYRIILNGSEINNSEYIPIATYKIDQEIGQFKGLQIKPDFKIIKNSEGEPFEYEGLQLALIHEKTKYNTPLFASFQGIRTTYSLDEIFNDIWKKIPVYLKELNLPYLIQDGFYNHIQMDAHNFQIGLRKLDIETKLQDALSDLKFTDFVTWRVKKDGFIAEFLHSKGNFLVGLFILAFGLGFFFTVPHFYHLIGLAPALFGLLHLILRFKKTTVGFFQKDVIFRKKTFFGLVKKEIVMPYTEMQFIVLETDKKHGAERIRFMSLASNFVFVQELQHKILRSYQALFILAATDFTKFSSLLNSLGVKSKRRE